MSERVKTRLAAWAAVLIWCSAYIATKIGLRYFSPFSLSVFRYLAAGAGVLVLMVIKRQKLPPLRDIPLFLLLGAAGYTLNVLTYNYGAGSVSVAAASVIVSATPVVTAVLAAVLLKEKLTGREGAATAIEFAGVVLVCLWDSGAAGGGNLEGAVWIVLSMLCFTAYNLLARLAVRRYDPLEVTMYSLAAAAVMFLFLAPGAISETKTCPLPGVISVLYMGLVCSGAAYLLWGRALERAESTLEVTNVLFFEPVVTSAMGAVMLGEIPSVGTAAGAAVCLLGLYLFETARR